MAADRSKGHRRRMTKMPAPTAAAPSTIAGSTGDAAVVGVSLGHVVGTFSVDFFIVVAVFTGVAVAAAAVVPAVVYSPSDVSLA